MPEEEDPIKKIAGSVGKIEGSVGQIAGVAEDAATYPILTKEANGNQIGGRNGDSPIGYSAGSSPTRTAQETIRRVLGWRYRGHDTKGFLAALNRAFDLKDVEGHVEWNWKPQNYMVQADLGEITGAQASILIRAKVAVEHALPLLEGLTPLREEADPDEMEAVRAIIRSALNELLREFGATRGPRVQRVDDYFDQLLGSNPDASKPETVGGHLGVLRERFGLEREKVNTIAEEQNLTNALILVDYVITLKQTWDANRRYFDRLRSGTEPFLGTQLVLLSQALEAVAESVREAYNAMDSVFFGALERQTTEIPLGVGISPLTVAELLGWVEDFATTEARQLIQDAGKDGVVAARRTLRQLRDLVGAAQDESEKPADNPAHGFHTNRVRRALQELETQLKSAHLLAADVRRFVVTAMNPKAFEETDFQTDTKNLTFIGENLTQVKRVFLTGPIPEKIEAQSLTAQPTQLIAPFDLGNRLFKSGDWIVVFASEEGEEVPLAKEFRLQIKVPPPQITVVTAKQDSKQLAVDISGNAFRQGAKPTLKKQGEADREATNVTQIGSKTIQASFSKVPAGDYTVLITNPDGQSKESKAFQITAAPPPKITGDLSPNSSPAKEGVTITIFGKDFDLDPKPKIKLVLNENNQVVERDGEITDQEPGEVKAKFNLSGAPVSTNWSLVLTNVTDGQLDKKGFKVT